MALLSDVFVVLQHKGNLVMEKTSLCWHWTRRGQKENLCTSQLGIQITKQLLETS